MACRFEDWLGNRNAWRGRLHFAQIFLREERVHIHEGSKRSALGGPQHLLLLLRSPDKGGLLRAAHDMHAAQLTEAAVH
jgi:hypothetical protein